MAAIGKAAMNRRAGRGAIRHKHAQPPRPEPTACIRAHPRNQEGRRRQETERRAGGQRHADGAGHPLSQKKQTGRGQRVHNGRELVVGQRGADPLQRGHQRDQRMQQRRIRVMPGNPVVPDGPPGEVAPVIEHVAADRDVRGIARNDAVCVFSPEELVADEKIQREEQGAANGELEQPDRSAAIKFAMRASKHNKDYSN
jgi:hypothetical protein